MFNVIGSFKGIDNLIGSWKGYPQSDIDSERKRLMDTFHMTAYMDRESV